MASDINPEFVNQLKAETAGVKLNLKAFGVKRTLDDQQTERAAREFNASSDFVTARKRIISTKAEAYREVVHIIGQARRFWRSMTVDYPIDGIRLIRRELIPVFDAEMKAHVENLTAALSTLKDKYPEMRQEAQARLGELYNADDYPSDITEFFSIDWEFPSIEPPDYLKTLNPKLYEQEQARIAARMEEAIRAAEDAFAVELKKMVDTLLDKLTPGADGKKKLIVTSNVTNLSEFFTRFNQLKVSNNAELNAVVEMAENLLGGVDPAELRKEAGLKASVASGLAEVAEKLSTLIVNKPTRAIDLSDDEPASGEPVTINASPATAA